MKIGEILQQSANAAPKNFSIKRIDKEEKHASTTF